MRIACALFCLVLSQSAMGQQYPLKDYCVAWDGKRLVTAVCYEPIDESGLPILTPRWIPMVEPERPKKLRPSCSGLAPVLNCARLDTAGDAEKD